MPNLVCSLPRHEQLTLLAYLSVPLLPDSIVFTSSISNVVTNIAIVMSRPCASPVSAIVCDFYPNDYDASLI